MTYDTKAHKEKSKRCIKFPPSEISKLQAASVFWHLVDHTPLTMTELQEKVEIPMVKCPALGDYLALTIEDVVIEKPDAEDPLPDYAPTILDAATGTGKTQQGISYLKKTGNIHYVNMARAESQPIYADINFILEYDTFEKFQGLCDKAISALQEAHSKARMVQRDLDEDYLSVGFMKKNKTLDAVNEVRDYLLRTELFYEDDKLYRANLDKNILASMDPSEKGRLLKNKALFVDEALFHNPENHNLTRLKFVRNFGRASGMKVCMAGTSSVCANMSLKPNDTGVYASSNRGGCTVHWMDFRLYWQPMTSDSLTSLLNNPNRMIYDDEPSNLLKDSSFQNFLLDRHRPFFVKEFVRPSRYHTTKDLRRTLVEVGDYLLQIKGLCEKKQFDNPNRLCRILTWISGVWLSSSNHVQKLSSHYFLPAPDMVRGHYFEPAVAVMEDILYPCIGHGRSHRVLGAPLVTSIRLTNVGINDAPYFKHVRELWLRSLRDNNELYGASGSLAFVIMVNHTVR